MLDTVTSPYIRKSGRGTEHLAALMELRRAGYGPHATDRFDAEATHLGIWGPQGPEVAVRLFVHESPAAARAGYTGQFYDLSRLAVDRFPMLEIGRLCQRPGGAAPDAMRELLGALSAQALGRKVGYVFGCCSLPGADPARHTGALAALKQEACDAAAPPARVAWSVPLSAGSPEPRAVPALLRSYIALGARVGPHAVRDTALDTLHVFTGLDPRDVPRLRARSLRRLAAEGQAG